MPNCFQLIRKSQPEAGPVVLTEVDEELCRHFGVSIHPYCWYENWYDIIGFRLALGRSFAEIWPTQCPRCEKGLPPLYEY